MNIAKTKEEFLSMLENNQFQIKNESDARKMIAGKFGEKLSSVDIDQFLNTCVFVNNSLGHCEYSRLKEKLTEDEFYEIFEYFGISKELFEDYKDMKCDGAHTCFYNWGTICTSSC